METSKIFSTKSTDINTQKAKELIESLSTKQPRGKQNETTDDDL